MCGTDDAVAQNAREFFIFVALGDGAMSQRLLCLLQIFQRGVIVSLILGQMAVGLRFLQVLVLGVGCLGNLFECLISVCEFAVADPSHCLLHAIGEAVGFVMGIA